MVETQYICILVKAKSYVEKADTGIELIKYGTILKFQESKCERVLIRIFYFFLSRHLGPDYSLIQPSIIPYAHHRFVNDLSRSDTYKWPCHGFLVH